MSALISVSFKASSAAQFPVLAIQSGARSRLTHCLFGPLSSSYRLLAPLLIVIEENEDGGIIVSDEWFDVYGVGDSQALAIQDYGDNLIHYYEALLEAYQASRISDYLKNHLLALRGIIRQT